MANVPDLTHCTRRRPRRSSRRAWLALPPLLVLLHLSAGALVVSHHHAPSAADTCQACHAAHGAAPTPPAATHGVLPAAGRALHDAPRHHTTLLPIVLRVRGPPAPFGAA